MAIATTAGSPVNYDMSTPAGAHQFMLALHGYMLKVGLSRATTGTDYDVNGTSSQLPTTYAGTSGWLAYNFTDSAQSTFPITVWFRVVWGNTTCTNTASYRYVPQYRISEGQSSGSPLGANLECFDGISTTTMGGATAYTTTYGSSVGDFVRYSGNALTVIMAGNGHMTSYSNFRSSLLEFHIERRYNVSDGSVGRGFTGWVPYSVVGTRAPPMYSSSGASDAYPAHSRATIYVSSNESTNIVFHDSHTRPLDARLTIFSGAALAGPVYFMDPTHRPTPAMKLFTVPLSLFSQTGVYSLNFTGVEKPYLIYRPYTSTMASAALAYAIEWE